MELDTMRIKLRHAAMRRALFEWMYGEANKNLPPTDAPRPVPCMVDEYIEKELVDILFPDRVKEYTVHAVTVLVIIALVVGFVIGIEWPWW
jgi:hypothetical protein